MAGTVTDAGTGQPLADVGIAVAETGAYAITEADGSYALPLQVGSYTLSFDSFYYYTTTSAVTVSSGATTTRNIALALLPTVEIGGTTLRDDGVTNLPGMRVTPRDVPIGGTQSDGQGDWAIAGFPMGHEYSFLFDGIPGYGAECASLQVADPGRFHYGLFVQVPEAAADFEGGPGGFTADAIWSHGTPVGAGGPTAGFSGTRCWGVGMNGNYGDEVSGYLTSPAYDFAGEGELRLSFHYWCETEANYDGAALDVWDASSSGWVPLTPLTDYNSMALGGLAYRDGWSGSTGGWVGAVFDLTAHISSQVRFRLHFGSDQGVNDDGFWVDDIAFDTGDVMSDVGSEPRGSGIALLSHGPNPFAAATRIALVMPGSETVDVAVFDAAGRRVRTLKSGRVAAGETQLAWDGRDDRGDALASGMYFVRMEVEGDAFTRRIVLAR